MALRHILAVCAIVCTSPVLAQDAAFPAELNGMLGDWVIEQEDPDLPQCALTLLSEPSIAGYAVTVPEPCPAPFPPTDDIMAWNVDSNDGSFVLISAERHVVLRFFEEEDGLYATENETGPQFTLVPYSNDSDGGEADAD